MSQTNFLSFCRPTATHQHSNQVWGLDFGDCHRSLFAHQDAVTAVSFVRDTHYAFSAGKDKAVKYWDLDRWALGSRMLKTHSRAQLLVSPTASLVPPLPAQHAQHAQTTNPPTNEPPHPVSTTKPPPQV
jgi:WD40 repeat protein